MRKSKSLVIAASLALFLAAAPMQAMSRFERDTTPIGRFMKLVKKFFGVSISSDLTGPIPTTTPTSTP